MLILFHKSLLKLNNILTNLIIKDYLVKHHKFFNLKKE